MSPQLARVLKELALIRMRQAEIAAELAQIRARFDESAPSRQTEPAWVGNLTTWFTRGTCPVCGAVDGEHCRPVDRQPESPGVHAGRLIRARRDARSLEEPAPISSMKHKHQKARPRRVKGVSRSGQRKVQKLERVGAYSAPAQQSWGEQ